MNIKLKKYIKKIIKRLFYSSDKNEPYATCLLIYYLSILCIDYHFISFRLALLIFWLLLAGNFLLLFLFVQPLFSMLHSFWYFHFFLCIFNVVYLSDFRYLPDMFSHKFLHKWTLYKIQEKWCFIYLLKLFLNYVNFPTPGRRIYTWKTFFFKLLWCCLIEC